MKYRSLYKNTHGVVMMETLLTLPLYLILLACLFWLGEVCLAKVTLVQSANLRLWEGSTQHTIGQIPEVLLFHFLPEIAGADVVTGRSGFAFAVRVNSSNDGTATAGWGRRRAGNGSVTLRRSAWSWSVNSFALNLLPTVATLPANVNQGMTSRQTPNLLSRNSYTNRQNIYGNGTNDGASWKTHYRMTWNLGTTVGTINPASGGNYVRVTLYGARDGSYVGWSN